MNIARFAEFRPGHDFIVNREMECAGRVIRVLYVWYQTSVTAAGEYETVECLIESNGLLFIDDLYRLESLYHYVN